MDSKKMVIIQIILIGIIVFFINAFFYQICFVRGNSMYPTLKNGEMVLAKKFNLNLQYDNIIIIKKGNNIIIKRLVGLPNDVVKIDQYLYINGEKAKDVYIEDSGDLTGEITLKSNEYFVIGDNYQHSIDSRFSEIGIIYENEIIGKIVLPRL